LFLGNKRQDDIMISLLDGSDKAPRCGYWSERPGLRGPIPLAQGGQCSVLKKDIEFRSGGECPLRGTLDEVSSQGTWFGSGRTMFKDCSASFRRTPSYGCHSANLGEKREPRTTGYVYRDEGACRHTTAMEKVTSFAATRPALTVGGTVLSGEPPIGSSRSRFPRLIEWSQKLFQKLRTLGELTDVSTDLLAAAPRVKVTINRDQAARASV